MKDLIRKILHEDNRDRLSGIIKKYIESTISPEYRDEICNIEVTDSEGLYRKIYRITITFDVVPSSNQINIMTDVFLMVHRFFDITPEMESRFKKGCQSNQSEVTEYSRTLENVRQQGAEELNERCWKGYTQKGMKTMFGKRYPNCVKKKK
jgi:hypothetical protein